MMDDARGAPAPSAATSRRGSQRHQSLPKLQKEIQQLKTKLALGGGGGGAADDDKIQIGGSTLIARR